MREHNCNVRTTLKKQSRSVERWTAAFLDCLNLMENNIPTVICERKCVNPVTCERIAGFIGRPVTIRRNVTNRRGVSSTIEVPVACKCVTTNLALVADCSRNST